MEAIWITATNGLVTTVAAGAWWIMKQQIRAEVKALQSEMNERIAKVEMHVTEKFSNLPASLNGIYVRSEACQANLMAVRDRLLRLERLLEPRMEPSGPFSILPPSR